MKMRFLRLTGLPVRDDVPWSSQGMTASDLRTQARDALIGHYQQNEKAFWPAKPWVCKAPERVIIEDQNGVILASYDIRDVIDEEHLSLVGVP